MMDDERIKEIAKEIALLHTVADMPEITHKLKQALNEQKAEIADWILEQGVNGGDAIHNNLAKQLRDKQ